MPTRLRPPQLETNPRSLYETQGESEPAPGPLSGFTIKPIGLNSTYFLHATPSTAER